MKSAIHWQKKIRTGEINKLLIRTDHLTMSSTPPVWIQNSLSVVSNMQRSLTKLLCAITPGAPSGEKYYPSLKHVGQSNWTVVLCTSTDYNSIRPSDKATVNTIKPPDKIKLTIVAIWNDCDHNLIRPNVEHWPDAIVHINNNYLYV